MTDPAKMSKVTPLHYRRGVRFLLVSDHYLLYRAVQLFDLFVDIPDLLIDIFKLIVA